MSEVRSRVYPILLSLTVFLLSFLTRPASGSEEDKKLRPPAHVVVVTATRLETPEREVASSVTVLGREKLEAMNRTTVLEALQDVMGLSVQHSGPPGGAASVFIRGANPEHTLVLLDGVEMNDPISPTRMFDLAHLRLEDVERIEILRGPQSTLYGSDAMGGVIHVITRGGEGRPRFRLSGLTGSYSTLSAGLALAGEHGAVGYSVGSSYMKTAGFSAAGSSYPGNEERDGCRSLSFSGRMRWAVQDGTELELAAAYGANRMDLDNFGGAYGDDPNHRQDYNSLLVRGTLRSRLLENRWQQLLNISYIRHERVYDNPEDDAHPLDSEAGSFAGARWKLDWQNNFYLLPSHTLTAGLELESESGQSDYVSRSAWGVFESPFPEKSAGSAGLYLQDQIRVSDILFAAAGVRLDRHDVSGTALTWRLAPAVLIPALSSKIRASLGTGFKAPSLYQLYAPGTLWGPVGNPALKPERSLGWDFGLEQTLFRGTFMASAGIFSNSFRDMIQFDYARGYSNIGRAESKGFELEVEAGPWPWLGVEASYTRTKARDMDSGLDLLRRPLDKFSAALRLQSAGRARLVLSATHLGSRDDLDYSGWAAQRVKLEPFLLLGASASLTLRKDIELFLRLDNILDRKYELVRGYGTAGFSVYAGVRIGSNK